MRKRKTHQATVKRVIRTKRGKLLRRQAGQDHFNARESSKVTTRKRRDVPFARADRRNIQKFIAGER